MATKENPKIVEGQGAKSIASLHPAWMQLIRYCANLGHGEIEKLKIQDGVPIIADVVREKVKFT